MACFATETGARKALSQVIFERHDTDNTGSLSPEEFKEYICPYHYQSPVTPAVTASCRHCYLLTDPRPLCLSPPDNLGHFLSDTEFGVAMAVLDADGNGHIAYDEFLAWYKTGSSKLDHLRPSHLFAPAATAARTCTVAAAAAAAPAARVAAARVC